MHTLTINKNRTVELFENPTPIGDCSPEELVHEFIEFDNEWREWLPTDGGPAFHYFACGWRLAALREFDPNLPLDAARTILDHLHTIAAIEEHRGTFTAAEAVEELCSYAADYLEARAAIFYGQLIDIRRPA